MLSVLLPLDDVADAGAGSRRLARLVRGSPWGRWPSLGTRCVSADVVAAQDAEVAELHVDAFDALVEAHPAIGATVHVNLARFLAERLRTANEQLRLLSRLTGRSRRSARRRSRGRALVDDTIVVLEVPAGQLLDLLCLALGQIDHPLLVGQW